MVEMSLLHRRMIEDMSNCSPGVGTRLDGGLGAD